MKSSSCDIESRGISPEYARIRIIAATAFFFGLVTFGFDTLLPLWTTHELGMSAGDYANLRVLRMIGIFAGVIVLGAISDRCGQKRIAVFALLGSGISLLCTLLYPWALWITLPVLGALVSTGMINLNTITQGASIHRPGMANSVYRGMYAITSIAAPVLVTWLAMRWHGYSSVLILLVGSLLTAALILNSYPGQSSIHPWQPFIQEVRNLWQRYHYIMRCKALMRFMHVSILANALLASVSLFAAIYFTRYLDMPDRQFGLWSGAAGLLLLLLTAGLGLLLDRIPLQLLHLILLLIAGGCTLLMGFGATLTLILPGFLVALALQNLIVAPNSLWIGRAVATDARTSAFTVHKVLSATYFAATTAVFGILERLIGIQGVWVASGVLCMLLALAFIAIPAPAVSLPPNYIEKNELERDSL